MSSDERRRGTSEGADASEDRDGTEAGEVGEDTAPGRESTATAEVPRHAGAPIGRVTAYKVAIALGEQAWGDAKIMKREPLLADIAPQLVRSVGSISANVAEGYTRRSARERIRFYEYALGSAEEAGAWYCTARYALPAGTLVERTDRLTVIRRLLLVMIRNERAGNSWNSLRRKSN